MGLVPASIGNGSGVHINIRRLIAILCDAPFARMRVTLRGKFVGEATLPPERVDVARHLLHGQGFVFCSDSIANSTGSQAGTCARVHRDPATEIGQAERGSTVPPISGPEEREQRRILSD